MLTFCGLHNLCLPKTFFQKKMQRRGAFDGLGGVATTKGETRADVCTWAQEEFHGTREAA